MKQGRIISVDGVSWSYKVNSIKVTMQRVSGGITYDIPVDYFGAKNNVITPSVIEKYIKLYDLP